ncbi:MAG: flagellar hook-associated protein FlgK [bacterium]
MAGLFDAISMAKQSLMAQQWAIATTGHNIANVNTPGYTRQRAELVPAELPMEVTCGFIGMGVDVAEIARLRNRYLDRQVLYEEQNLGFLDFQNTALSQVEIILGETSGNGLSGVLNDFWASWSDLANDPENSAVRIALQQKGAELSQNLNNLYTDLTSQQQALDTQLTGLVNQINQKTSQIASLNKTISSLVLQGQNPNDLMDQRDLLIEGLASLVNIEMQDESDGTISIWLGGQILVNNDSAQSLNLQVYSSSTGQLHSVVWNTNGKEADFLSGQVASLLLVRDEVIPELLSGLDEFAVGLVESVNAIHQTGYSLDGSTGLDFFNPATTGAANIALSQEISLDADKIAASADGSAGNGEIALAIFNLQNQMVIGNDLSTLNEYYAALVADVGALAQTAQNELAQSETALQQLQNWQMSAEGVSLDEEMANLVRYQQAYTALSKFLATADTMLEQLLAVV